MRGVRSLLVLVVVAIPLIWYAVHESKQEPDNGKKQEKVFTGVEADKIDQVTIKSESGDHTTVQRQSGKWQVTSPTPIAADDAELSGLASNLASLEVQRVVDEQATDLKQYGLDPARIDVTFKQGGQERRLLIGQKTPSGSDLYAKVPDKPRVFLISSYLDATFNRSTFDLRDKTVLKIDREKVDSLDITREPSAVAAKTDTDKQKTTDQKDLKDKKPETTAQKDTPKPEIARELKFTKSGADWKMTAPVDARADFGAVEGIIGRLNTAQMKSLASPTADDLKKYGLDKPAVTVKLGSGSSQAGLLIGNSAGENVVYAKDISRPLIFTIESAVADELKKPADDFRVKDLFDARSFNTTRVEVVRGGQTLAWEKSKAPAKGNEPAKDVWKQVAPAAKDVDAAKVDALLNALTNARAASFPEKPGPTGLDAPELAVTIKYEDGQKQERVLFGRHGSDAFARRDGDAGAAKIDASSLDAIVKALDALK
jgi:hypothetical protein